MQLAMPPEDQEAVRRAAEFYGITFNEFIRRAVRAAAYQPLVRLASSGEEWHPSAEFMRREYHS